MNPIAPSLTSGLGGEQHFAALGEYDRRTNALPPAQPAKRIDPQQVELVLRVTEELFGLPVTVEVEHDPDGPREPWLLFVVSSKADIPTILRLERLWHERTAQIAPDHLLDFRLGVNPLE